MLKEQHGRKVVAAGTSAAESETAGSESKEYDSDQTDESKSKPSQDNQIFRTKTRTKIIQEQERHINYNFVKKLFKN